MLTERSIRLMVKRGELAAVDSIYRSQS